MARAEEYLTQAAELLRERGRQRDVDQERSMKRVVAIFNAATNYQITEEDGWLFMQCLKVARQRIGATLEDDYLDEIAYAALRAECALSAS